MRINKQKNVFAIILILFIAFVSANLYGKTDKIKIDSKKIELQFDNIFIKSMKFHKKDYIKIEYDKNDKLESSYFNNVFSLSSSNNMKVKILLPEKVEYDYYFEDQGVCHFGKQYLTIDIKDGEYIEFKENSLMITEKDKNKTILINNDEILVKSDDENVNISSNGIIVKSESEDEDLTNFWGKLLGYTIKEIASLAIKTVSKNPGKVVKDIINEEDKKNINSKMFNVNFGESSNFGINVDLGSNDRIKREVHLTYSGKSNLTLNVESNNGKIEIVPWDDNYVNIDAELSTNKDESKFDKIKISVIGSKSGDVCNIKTIEEENNLNVSVNYLIKIPIDSKVGEIITSNGAIYLKNVNGNVTAITGNGKINIENMTGNVSSKTSNGKIDVSNLNGNITAKTSNGKIELTEIYGIVSAHTSNGKIELNDVKEISSISTSNGVIYAEINEINSDADVSTSNSEIKVFLNKNINAKVIANTSNSKIRIEDLDFSKQSTSNNYFKGVLGNGENTLSIRSSNGSIKLGVFQKSY
ncbi:MAG: hypothetical protein K8S23_00355 [Candidatus Cloacimonetes bacterium]|nr:hypothetical protein [Candidatus Cloacimonadota bacterium]